MGTHQIFNENCEGFAYLLEFLLYKIASCFNNQPNLFYYPLQVSLLFFLLSQMAHLLNWVPPPVGILKVNTYAVSFAAPMPNGNTCGMGVVFKTSNGNMVNCIAGTIPGLTPLSAGLWGVQIGLRKAFVEGAKSVIIKIDNLAAFGVIQFAHLHQHPEVDDLLNQIITRLRDPNWDCSLRFVYPERNRVAEYASLLGGELFCRLYIFFEPVGRMAELMDLDLGLGPQNPQFLEASMVNEEQEVFEKIMEDGGVVLANEFMHNLVINGNGEHDGDLNLFDVVYEDELNDIEDEDDLFDLF